MKIITIHQNKGGVGKTTIIKALVDQLAKTNKKVLVIDLDGQSSITEKYNIVSSNSLSYKWLTKSPDIKQTSEYVTNILLNTIKQTETNNIFVVPGGRDLYQFKKLVESEVAAEKILGRNLQIFKKDYKDKYDYVFIDLNPSWDIYAFNAYLASDSIIQILDRTEDALSGLLKNIYDWEDKCLNFDIENKINGVILNRIKTDKMSKEIILASESLKNIKKLKFNTFIPENANIEKSVVSGGRSVVDISSLKNWKPSKTLQEWLSENELKIQCGNPFVNLIEEMLERGVL